MMEDDQQFCLRWNNHQSTLISVFDTLLENEKLVDCTLAAEGRIMKAHKVVLSACSPYFATLLQEQYDKHPIFILKDVKYQELRAMMDYMYRGEVNISQDQLAALLKAAESLQIKGLSDNRTGAPAPRAEQQPQQQPQQHHRGLNVPGGSKLGGGYTLEAQTKRARVGAGPLDSQDISGSREGSSSPSRRRRKVRRKSIENAMAEPHDSSNSSQQQQASLLQSNAALAGVSAITAAASALASQLPTVSGVATTGAAIGGSTQAIASAQQPQQQQQLQQQQQQGQLTTTTSVTKKTENVKGTSDAINTENVQVAAVAGGNVAAGIIDSETLEQHVKSDKQNHKQKQSGGGVGVGVGVGVSSGGGGKEGSELVIEPKSEYDEEGNDETCEDLTLDDEDMGMDDLDQNAGTSQGGEGSSQGYAAWQHDRSQDEILLSTQEAQQQRDPQDLSRRIAHLHKENKVPSSAVLNAQIQKTNQRSILNTTERRNAAAIRRTSNPINAAVVAPPVAPNSIGTIPVADDNSSELHKRFSMADVSGMLLEFYKTNVAKAPKTQQQQLQLKYRQTSPTSAETYEPSTIAAIATNGANEAAAAAAAAAAKASKNLQGGEVPIKASGSNENDMKSMAFHPRIKYSIKNLPDATKDSIQERIQAEPTIMTAIPTSVVVPTSPQIDVKPIINPTTGFVIDASTASGSMTASVIRPVPQSNAKTVPSATAIAAALLQQQLRAQELQRQKSESAVSSKILEKLLRQQRQHDDASNANDDDDRETDDDTYDERYNGFEDIHLTEDSKQSSNYGVSTSMPNIFQSSMATAAGANDSANSSAGAGAGAGAGGEYFAAQSQKLFLAQAQAQAMRNLDFSFNDFSADAADAKPGNLASNPRTTSPHNSSDASGEAVYECRHCGKKYRWKSTLRRHENVECGGKEPSHQCPYCPYKSKQRGNLGVHVRKHHTDLPQLASKRRSKYSQNINNGMGAASEHHNSSVSFSGNASDDSSSKLVIDFKIKSPQND